MVLGSGRFFSDKLEWSQVCCFRTIRQQSTKIVQIYYYFKHYLILALKKTCKKTLEAISVETSTCCLCGNTILNRKSRCWSVTKAITTTSNRLNNNTLEHDTTSRNRGGWRGGGWALRLLSCSAPQSNYQGALSPSRHNPLDRFISWGAG